MKWGKFFPHWALSVLLLHRALRSWSGRSGHIGWRHRIIANFAQHDGGRGRIVESRACIAVDYISNPAADKNVAPYRAIRFRHESLTSRESVFFARDRQVTGTLVNGDARWSGQEPRPGVIRQRAANAGNFFVVMHSLDGDWLHPFA